MSDNALEALIEPLPPRPTLEPEPIYLVGEPAAAHLALQEAAREAHAAQATLTAAQTKLRACMERWLKANGSTP